MKLLSKALIYTLLSISTTSFTATAGEPTPDKLSLSSSINNNPTIITNHVDAELQVNSLLSFANKFRGVPYRWGGTTPRGFDCSGFTSYVFNKFGYKLARMGRYQLHNGDRVDRSQLKPGDLVFFGGRANRPGIGHVGIVTAVDGNGHDFSFIHASTRRGITVSHSSESYYNARYRSACRIIKVSNVGNKINNDNLLKIDERLSFLPAGMVDE